MTRFFFFLRGGGGGLSECAIRFLKIEIKDLGRAKRIIVIVKFQYEC